MSEKALNEITIIGISLIGFFVLGWWMLTDPTKDFVENVPGMDNRPASFSGTAEVVAIGSLFMAYDGVPSDIRSNWPRFRGADFDNISKERIRLAEHWPEKGPNVIWSVDLGEGHAGPAVADGRVYVMDYDEERRADILRCFSLDDGREIWRRGYDIYIKRNHGMSRTVPAVHEQYVVTMGPKCQVMCVDTDSGRFKWGIDLVKEYEIEVPLWYTGQCPLIRDSLAIIATGGKALMIAIHLETGEVVWQTPNPHGWQMSHSSIMPMTIYGKKVYVYCTLGGLIGVSAEAGSQGELLFETAAWNSSVVAPSPVYLGDGKIFVTAGYGAGSMVLQVNGTWEVEPVQVTKPDEGIASEQQTPILYKNHLFAILPKDAGPSRNQFVCCQPDDSKKFIWTSGKTDRFGLGPYIVADDKFFILSDDGILTLAKADTREYIQLAQAKVLQGHDAWGPMAIANGRLLVRDSRRMVCLDVLAHTN